MGNLNCYHAEDRRFDSLFGWLYMFGWRHYSYKNGSQHVGGCNPLLKVAALTFWNGKEATWLRYIYALQRIRSS